MNSQLTQALLALLAHVLVASIASALVYFAFRSIERNSQFSVRLLSYLIIISAFIVVVAANLSYKLAAVNAFGILLGLIGAVFHQKSTVKPSDFFTSFVMMTAVTLTSLFASLIAISFFSFPPFSNFSTYISNPYLNFLVWILMMAQSITTPFFIWVWKNSRLRPGIDKHLED